MKIVLLVVLLIPTVAVAQLLFDTAYVVFRGDTTEIWQKGYRNCASQYVTETSLSNDTLRMFQTDTSRDHATCDCYYTMRTTVVGLSASAYHGIFYFRELKKYWPWLPTDTAWAYSSIDFTVSQVPASAPAFMFRQSTCNGSLENVPVSMHPIVPDDLHLSIYPNPFNPETTIEYTVVQTRHVSISIFNVLGQRVADLVDEPQSPGIYRLRFSSGSHATGAYICRLQVGTQVISRQFTALR